MVHLWQLTALTESYRGGNSFKILDGLTEGLKLFFKLHRHLLSLITYKEPKVEIIGTEGK
jgi:hypothetical protein